MGIQSTFTELWPTNLHKIISNFGQVYRVNCFEKSVGNWSVVRVTVTGVHFGGLKEIKIKAMKIQCKTNSVQQSHD